MAKPNTLLVALAAALLAGGGCGVKKQTHQKVLDTLATTQGELSENQRLLAVQKTRVKQLETELSATRTQRDLKSQAELDKKKRIDELLKKIEAAQGKEEDLEGQLRKLEAQNKVHRSRLQSYAQLNTRLRSLVDTGKMSVAFRNGQMILKLPSNVLFASGKATLSKIGKAALQEVFTILLEFKDRRFAIAGHTDNRRIRGKFKNNWELSTARAVSVVRAMVTSGFDPKNLAASGFAQHDPVDTNDTEVGRANNRRIEIILVPDLSQLPNLTLDP